VLVGPSGCGKSTLLRLIAGLETVTEGSISIGERDVTQLESRDRDIAMVFQSYALYPHMSVRENLGFGLKLRGHAPADIDKRVAAAAQTLGLDPMLERLPKQLSGGQRQRVALGRALVRQPQVFLLDEPLSNLDAKLRGVMRTEIARLHRSLATTMIYVTHDQVEAMTLGQRIVVMNEGKIQQLDAPMEIYRRPVNLFVAGFLGNPAMNFFRGRFEDGATPAIVAGNARLPLEPGARSVLSSGQETIAGLRPEDLEVAAGGSPSSGVCFSVAVELVECVGNEAFIHARLGDWPLIARTSPHDLPQPGTQVTLCANTEHMHFFDASTSQRIGPRA
jgi:multiple sugar transport system ATP-binding protein